MAFTGQPSPLRERQGGFIPGNEKPDGVDSPTHEALEARFATPVGGLRQGGFIPGNEKPDGVDSPKRVGLEARFASPVVGLR
jgi:hypothetical protein